MNGYVIPDNIQKAMSNYNPKTFSSVRVEVQNEAVKTLDEISNEKPNESSIKRKEKNTLDKEVQRKNETNR